MVALHGNAEAEAAVQVIFVLIHHDLERANVANCSLRLLLDGLNLRFGLGLGRNAPPERNVVVVVKDILLVATIGVSDTSEA